MNKLKNGEEYEKYILNIIKEKYNQCYLWKDIPKDILNLHFYKNDKICDDIGCDIIGIKKDGTIDYIQCKNYSTTGDDNIINICDLAGFYNFIAENEFNNAIVYYSGKLSQQIICRQNKIKYINIPHIKNNNILEFKPREYQIDAYNKLKDVNRSILSMPCGTGKTFVSFLLSLNYKNILILTPLISTTEQIMIHFKNYYSKYNDINYILINCNAERNINNIKLNETKNIIASTYDSSDIIYKLLENTNNEDNLIIIDEFHNLSNDMITNKENNMNKILINISKILYMSATPLNTLSYESIFGNIKYELNWNDAIKNNYICDYNFYYPNNDKIIERINELNFDKSLIEKTILINKAYFLLESIKVTNVKKCIVYLKTINESEQFMKILKTMNIYTELNIKTYEINYNTTKKKRTTYLNKFKNDNTCVNILCNVHILDEGIDIPECDSVYLTHPNNNPINLIQRISRANRLDKNNKEKIAKVFVWNKDKLKLENIMNNINKVINVKYGNEYNDFVNVRKNEIKEVINNNDTSQIYDIEKIKKICQKSHPNNKNILKFIDDFHNIYTFDTENENEFIINIDIVTKWLLSTKSRLKETLVRSYNKNIDYKVSKEKSGKISKSNKEIIMLTPDCFKRLCLVSKTKKSEEVRTYFIELEKILDKYKSYIINAMKKQIEVLENNQKEMPNNTASMVYILKSPKDIDGIYRFGKTDDFKKRLQNYNSANSDKMEVVLIYETKCATEVEDCVIAQIKKYRYKKRKDFYEVNVDIIKEIINSCDNMALKYKRKIEKSKKQEGGTTNNLYLYISH
jgi:superfamily II DNA or RNA helicase/phage anti-repressor protein